MRPTVGEHEEEGGRIEGERKEDEMPCCRPLTKCLVSRLAAPRQQNRKKQHDRVTRSCEPIYLLKLATARGATQAPRWPGASQEMEFPTREPLESRRLGHRKYGWQHHGMQRLPRPVSPSPSLPAVLSGARAFPCLVTLNFLPRCLFPVSLAQLPPTLFRPRPGPDTTLRRDAHALAEPGPDRIR